MSDSERLETILVFIIALKKMCENYKFVPFDPRKFSSVIQGEQKKGNVFALRFPLYNSLTGKHCPDFSRGMSMAQSAGCISFLSSTFRFFVIQTSDRFVHSFDSISEKEKMGVRRVAKKYCVLTNCLRRK